MTAIVQPIHPDLITHDTLGLATQAELDAHAATPHGGTGSHPDLTAHDTLGLATDAELAAHAASPHGGTHPDLATHDTLGLATDAELSSHAGASTGVHGVGASTVESVAGAQAKVDTHTAGLDPHPVYATDADLAAHAADSTAVHGITDTAALVVTTDSRLSDARAPTGAAGGVLGGTYPSPAFAVDMATQAELDAHAGAADPHTGYARKAAANTFTAGPQRASLAAAGDDAWTTRLSADSQDRFIINADGKLEWGPGNAAPDVSLERVGGTIKIAPVGTPTDVIQFFNQVGQVVLRVPRVAQGDGGIRFDTALVPAGVFAELDAVASLAINTPQAGTRDTTRTGGIFRMDVRSAITFAQGKQSFIIYGYPVGGSSDTARLIVSLENGDTAIVPVAGTVAIGHSSPVAGEKVNLKPGAAANAGLVLQGEPSQTGPLLRLKDSAGNVLTDLLAGGSIDTSKGLAVGVASKTAAYTATRDDFLVLADATGGAFTVTLPPASNRGQIIVVKKTDSGLNSVTVSRAGTDTIQGTNTLILATQYDFTFLVADGTSTWMRLGGVNA